MLQYICDKCGTKDEAVTPKGFLPELGPGWAKYVLSGSESEYHLCPTCLQLLDKPLK